MNIKQSSKASLVISILSLLFGLVYVFADYYFIQVREAKVSLFMFIGLILAFPAMVIGLMSWRLSVGIAEAKQWNKIATIGFLIGSLLTFCYFLLGITAFVMGG